MMVRSKLLSLIFIILISPCISFADGFHWVASDGSATWANCRTATEVDPTSNYCSLDLANQSVQAGDTVELKGGTYTLSGGNNYDYGVSPYATGTSGAKITYKAVSGETPIIDSSDFAYNGIAFRSVNYIVVDGITFRNVKTFASIVSSSYNEIKNCTFGPTTADGSVVSGMFHMKSGSTHNWVHDNTFKHGVGADSCGEGTDLIRIGTGYSVGSVDMGDNYNTVEDNVLYGAAHTVIDNFGMYNVIRNNIAHNEPWITTCTAGQVDLGKAINYDVSESPVEVGTGNKNFTVSAGKTFATGKPVGAVRTSDHTVAMQGTVSSYSGTTLVINVAYALGSGTFSDWTITKANFPQYDTAAYDGKFGHRNFQVSDDYVREGLFNLYEGNRLGHASNNPGNGGPMNFDVAAPKNIIRYNDLFNGMSSGMYFKYASADLTSAITSISSVEMGTGEKTFTIPQGLHLTNGQTIRIWNTAAKTNAMTGTVTSYTSETGVLVVDITATKFNYDTGSHLPTVGQLLYGETSGAVIRVSSISNTGGWTGTGTGYIYYTLKSGTLSVGEHIHEAASGDGTLVCVVTANDTYDTWQVFWNGASGGVNNRIYNNTIYHNGYGYDWRAYGNENVAYSGQGISQINGAATGSTLNVIKNNIIYDNKEGAVCGLALYDGDGTPDQCTTEEWDTVTNNYTSDPSFTDDDVSDATSLILPDLTLQEGSGARDKGTYLTTVHADDTGSGDSLKVTDALYFQAGSAAATKPIGSSLSNIQADYIKVGATLAAAEEVQITDINYSTNTLTISPAITRADGEYVWLSRKSDGVVVLVGDAPDAGAHEYGTGATTHTLTIAKSGDGATITTGELEFADGYAYEISVTRHNGWNGAWSTSDGTNCVVSECAVPNQGATGTCSVTVNADCTVTYTATQIQVIW
jgi:hypothetical protein